MKISTKTEDSISTDQFQKIEKARKLLEKVFGSEEFKEKVLNHQYLKRTYSGRYFWRKLVRSEMIYGFEGLPVSSNVRWDVLNKILSGSEVLSPQVDGEADIEIVIASGHRGVLGWTNPHTPKQWISKWFFDSSKPSDLAGNLAHEYCHKLGFDHAFNAVPNREFTVPYAVGYIVRDMAERIVL